jgi:hypothetical protein
MTAEGAYDDEVRTLAVANAEFVAESVALALMEQVALR